MSMQAARVRLSIVLCLGITLCVADPGYPAYPAGATNAVLSFVDAAGSHASVNRHWPGYSQDVQVYPFTPYFWNSCLPGDGAIMLLLTGPGYQPPVGTSAEAYTSQYLTSLGRRVAASLSRSPHASESDQLRTIIAGLTIPGNPAYESLKEGLLWVNSLASYESYGYAVFLMIHWKWVFPFPGCYADTVTVPEGYGIPYVALNSPGKKEQRQLAMMCRLVLARDLQMVTRP